MNYRLPFLLLFLCLVFSGCGKSGPKQTLIFKTSRLPGATGPIDMATTKRIVIARVRGAETGKSFRVTTSATDDVEVAVYGASERDLEKIKALVTVTGSLELAAVADAKINQKIVALAQDAAQQVVVDGVVQAEWLPIATNVTGLPKPELQSASNVISRQKEVDGKQITQWLVVYTPGQRITGAQMKSASATIDQVGHPAVNFVLNDEGSLYMSILTTELRPVGPATRSLAIIFDGTIFSAPSVQSTIHSQAMISGDFSQAQVDQIVNVIRGGSIPCQITFDKFVTEK